MDNKSLTGKMHPPDWGDNF